VLGFAPLLTAGAVVGVAVSHAVAEPRHELISMQAHGNLLLARRVVSRAARLRRVGCEGSDSGGMTDIAMGFRMGFAQSTIPQGLPMSRYG
jgi:hypothetical protein